MQPSLGFVISGCEFPWWLHFQTSLRNALAKFSRGTILPPLFSRHYHGSGSSRPSVIGHPYYVRTKLGAGLYRFYAWKCEKTLIGTMNSNSSRSVRLRETSFGQIHHRQKCYFFPYFYTISSYSTSTLLSSPASSIEIPTIPRIIKIQIYHLIAVVPFKTYNHGNFPTQSTTRR